MVLVRDRRAEQRHDAVAGELVDRALEAVDALAEDREEALHDLAPLLGVAALGEVHRAHHVGEQHRHVLALPFQHAAGADLPGELLGDVGVERGDRGPGAGRCRPACSGCQLVPAAVAESLTRRVGRGAARADEWCVERRSAGAAESRPLGIGVVTARAVQVTALRADHTGADATHERDGRAAPGTLAGPGMPLSAFTPQVRDWFERAFAEPTEAQRLGLAGDRRRRARPDQRTDGLGQDARGVPVGHRPARRRPARRRASAARGSSTSHRSRRSPTTSTATSSRRSAASART